MGSRHFLKIGLPVSKVAVDSESIGQGELKSGTIIGENLSKDDET